MQIPVQIVFRDMKPSPAVEVNIRARVDKLQRFYDRIMSCRVVVEQRHRHGHKGNPFHVRIDVTVPNDELVVSRDPTQHQAHEDAYVAIRDAFDAIRRQLEDYVRRQRGDIKTHETPPHGRVVELNAGADYGRIETLDGKRVYFHRNCVVDGDFAKLQIGTEVRFVEEPGELGPQASTVHVLGKHHLAG
ncbi:MAG TPA: HPF/RaiA family ribosome-associated protein [Burkholderiales bacterium]|jgi:ribosomal subunit interface protein